jgi:hypothetical protein
VELGLSEVGLVGGRVAVDVRVTVTLFVGLKVPGIGDMTGNAKKLINSNSTRMEVINKPMDKVLDIFFVCWFLYLCRINNIATCSISSRMVLNLSVARDRNWEKYSTIAFAS